MARRRFSRSSSESLMLAMRSSMTPILWTGGDSDSDRLAHRAYGAGRYQQPADVTNIGSLWTSAAPMLIKEPTQRPPPWLDVCKVNFANPFL